MHSESSQAPNLSGMTVNERLFTLGLLDEFDSLVRRGEREGMVALLKRAELMIAMPRRVPFGSCPIPSGTGTSQ